MEIKANTYQDNGAASLTASIIGASGYSGAELTKILARHRRVKIGGLFANSLVGKRVDEVHPWLHGDILALYEAYAPELIEKSDVVFIALPSGEAMKFVPELLDRGKKVIDLGGDFRLKDPALYRKYYGRDHTATDYLERAIYGLPEWNRAAIAAGTLIANPGCYPTSALLPLMPLLKESVIAGRGIIINSVSGTSGAGRSASVDLIFSEVNESVKAYKVGTHQHNPEIRTVLGSVAAEDVSLTFIPHLVPITRGIYSNICAPLNSDISEGDVAAIYDAYYADAPFVRWSSTAIPEIRGVAHTNYIDIGVRVDRDNGQIVLLSAIDNLVKGAAGQAVQNMNILFGFEETEGL